MIFIIYFLCVFVIAVSVHNASNKPKTESIHNETIHEQDIHRESNAEILGNIGENKVHEILKQLPKEYFVLNDLIIETGKGYSTQIDHIVISKYGIFIIETKNYRGVIYGSDEKDQWKQVITYKTFYRRRKYRKETHVYHFYNPVKQNMSHVHTIQYMLNKYWRHFEIFPIVVFVGDADISKVNSTHCVIESKKLLSVIQQHKDILLNDTEIISIYYYLRKFTNYSSDIKTNHVNNVKNIIKETDNKISSGVCPRCGGRLVLRKNKFGEFYGCSNYPNCKYLTSR